jgi:hypothetical protein
MDYFSNTAANAGSTISTKPNAHDFDQLRTIYSHLDSSTTLASFGGAFAEVMASKDADISDDPNWTLEAAARCKSCDHRHGR